MTAQRHEDGGERRERGGEFSRERGGPLRRGPAELAQAEQDKDQDDKSEQKENGGLRESWRNLGFPAGP